MSMFLNERLLAPRDTIQREDRWGNLDRYSLISYWDISNGERKKFYVGRPDAADGFGVTFKIYLVNK